MFSTILIPTDGSETLSSPLEAAIQQVKLTHGKIIALAVIEIAEKHKCDAIFMASHRRKGLMQMFVGSQTQKVLAHATIPVMVFK